MLPLSSARLLFLESFNIPIHRVTILMDYVAILMGHRPTIILSGHFIILIDYA